MGGSYQRAARPGRSPVRRPRCLRVHDLLCRFQRFTPSTEGDLLFRRGAPRLKVMALLSILDLAPITQGSDAAQSFRNTLDLARHAERWGYRRYWLAEHHNLPGVASAATAVVIGSVAACSS